MTDTLFYIFAALTLLAGLQMIMSSNTVNSAMYMIVSFVGTAAMFVLLEAYLLAVLQILVYAGAVVVLFLFIIMLLNVDKAESFKPDKMTFISSIVALGALSYCVGVVFLSGQGGEMPAISTDIAAPASVAQNFGFELFTKYMLPLQLMGFLLLIAMIGVIYISKKQRTEEVTEISDANTQASQS